MRRLDRNQKKEKLSRQRLSKLGFNARTLLEYSSNVYASSELSKFSINHLIEMYGIPQGRYLIVSLKAAFECSKEEIFDFKYKA